MYSLRKTYQKYIVVEKSEEKGSNENWYPMAYPQKKKEEILKEKKIGILWSNVFMCCFGFQKIWQTELKEA